MEQDKLLTIEEISEKLKDRKLHIVAKNCSLSYLTVQKMLNKQTNVNNNSLIKVSDYLTNSCK